MLLYDKYYKTIVISIDGSSIILASIVNLVLLFYISKLLRSLTEKDKFNKNKASGLADRQKK